MGLPQHWLQDDVAPAWSGSRRSPATRGVSIAIHTHVNHANSVTPLVAEATRAMLDAGIRDVRNQGVLLNGVNADPHALLDLCFALLDGAQIMPYYFYMCDMIPFSRALAGLGRRRPAAAAPHHGLPARLRDAADRLRRAVRRQALGAPARRLRPRARHLLLDEELPHLDRGRRPRGADPAPTSTTTRSTPCPPRARLVGRARPPRRVRPARRPRSPRPPAGWPRSRPTEAAPIVGIPVHRGSLHVLGRCDA